MSHHVTRNFLWSEITRVDPEELPDVTRYLLLRLAEDVLQPIRDFLGCPIRVTSGLRWPSDYIRLKHLGYNPSLTSDHFAGLPVRTVTENHRKRYGEFYWLSVGAADIVPSCGVGNAWNALRDVASGATTGGAVIMAHAGKIVCGQVINEGGWLHVSNPPRVLLSDDYSNIAIHRRPWLESPDRGKTYREVT